MLYSYLFIIKAMDSSNVVKYITFAICAVIVGIYSHNNTQLKNELQDANNARTEDKAFYEKQVTTLNSTLNSPVEYYCSDGLGDGKGIDIQVSQENKGTDSEILNFDMKVLDNIAIDSNGSMRVFCMRGKSYHPKEGRSFEVVK